MSEGRGGEGPWTVRRMLAWMTDDFAGRGIPSARLDAEVLLAHALSVQRVGLYLDMERPLAADELARIRALIKRRREHEPVAYILGRREFYGRAFAVDASVLIPRPDTELLVDEALARTGAQEPGRALDLCTGSGCVGLSLALERAGLHVDLTDLSADALRTAERNARELGVAERVSLLHGDLWACVPDGASYRLIVANPPYVRAAEYGALAPDITRHEPRAALVPPEPDEDGLSFYRRIAARAREFLAPKGYVLVEVGQGQAAAVHALLAQRFAHVDSVRDLGGIPRVVVASDLPPATLEGAEPRLEHTEDRGEQ